MCHFDPRNDGRHIDPCMVELVTHLQGHGVDTVASCCGHGIYPMTIVVKTDRPWIYRELFSGKMLETVCGRFYRKDTAGVYYIPEVIA